MLIIGNVVVFMFNFVSFVNIKGDECVKESNKHKSLDFNIADHKQLN